jgi:hypothetical protein
MRHLPRPWPGGLLVEPGHAEPAGELGGDPLERHVPRGEQHEQVIGEVGRLRHDPLVGLRGGGLHEFAGLFRHLAADRGDASGEQAAGVGSVGGASLAGRDHALELREDRPDPAIRWLTIRHDPHPRRRPRSRPGRIRSGRRAATRQL